MLAPGSLEISQVLGQPREKLLVEVQQIEPAIVTDKGDTTGPCHMNERVDDVPEPDLRLKGGFAGDTCLCQLGVLR